MLKTKFFIFLLLVLLHISSFAVDKILDINSFKSDIYENTLIYTDKEGNKNIKEIISSVKFEKNHTKDLNFGFSNNFIWLKIKITKTGNNTDKYALVLDNPDINYVNFYIVDNSNVIIDSVITGEKRPFYQRKIIDRKFVFKLNIDSSKIYDIYLRLNNEGDEMFIPLGIVQLEHYQIQKSKENLLLGFIYGLFLFIVFYNVFLYFTINDRIYLYYALYVLFLSLFSFNVDGLSSRFIWPEYTQITDRLTMIFMATSVFFLYNFSRIFLKTKEYFQKLDSLMKIITYIYVIFIFISFFDYPVLKYSVLGQTIFAAITVLVIMIASIAAITKKHFPAYFFIVAYFLIGTAVSLYVMKNFGIIPQSIFSINAFKIGLVGQSLLLSFAVLDRFRKNSKEVNLKLENQKKEIEIQKNILQNANEELKKLSIVASKTDNSIKIFDKDANIEWANEGFEKLYEIKLEKLIELRGRKLVNLSNYKNIDSLLNECINNKKTVIYESSTFTPQGREIWTQTTLTPLLNKSGEIEKLIAIDSDITKQKNIEKELIVAKNKAEESDKLKTTFLLNISHNIRTPLNSIMGFTSFMNDPDLTDKQRKTFINLILSNSKKLLKIIEDLILISQIERNELTLEKEEFNLNELIEQVNENFLEERIQSGKENIDIYINKHFKSDDLIVISDSQKISLILINLLSNALKFTEKGHIEFGYRLDGKEDSNSRNIEFFIKDTGMGISNDKIEMLFKKFVQIDNDNLKKTNSGLGLGLSISKSLVAFLGGNISFETNKQTGTTFKFTIPLELDRKFLSDKSNEYDWKNKKILILEQYNYNLIILKQLMIKNGSDIFCIKPDENILKLINEKEPHLIMVDIKYQEMECYYIIKKIRKDYKNIPIIAYTNKEIDNEKELSLNAGCNEFISKISDKNSIAIINKYLNF